MVYKIIECRKLFYIGCSVMKLILKAAFDSKKQNRKKMWHRTETDTTITKYFLVDWHHKY